MNLAGAERLGVSGDSDVVVVTELICVLNPKPRMSSRTFTIRSPGVNDTNRYLSSRLMQGTLHKSTKRAHEESLALLKQTREALKKNQEEHDTQTSELQASAQKM